MLSLGFFPLSWSMNFSFKRHTTSLRPLINSLRAHFIEIKDFYIRVGGMDKSWMRKSRGNGASVARIMPYVAVHYMAYEQYCRWIIITVPGIRRGHILDLVAGAVTGGTVVLFIYPLHLVRAKLVYQVLYIANKLIQLLKKKKSLRNWLDYYENKFEKKSSQRPSIKEATERESVISDPKSIMPAKFVSFRSRWGAALCALKPNNLLTSVVVDRVGPRTSRCLLA